METAQGLWFRPWFVEMILLGICKFNKLTSCMAVWVFRTHNGCCRYSTCIFVQP